MPTCLPTLCALQFFNWDTGSQLGEVIPHTKKNITCDFKPSRPFKAVFGGEDFNLSFYQVRDPRAVWLWLQCDVRWL